MSDILRATNSELATQMSLCKGSDSTTDYKKFGVYNYKYVCRCICDVTVLQYELKSCKNINGALHWSSDCSSTWNMNLGHSDPQNLSILSLFSGKLSSL